jgi:hypothetical protein
MNFSESTTNGTRPTHKPQTTTFFITTTTTTTPSPPTINHKQQTTNNTILHHNSQQHRRSIGEPIERPIDRPTDRPIERLSDGRICGRNNHTQQPHMQWAQDRSLAPTQAAVPWRTALGSQARAWPFAL